MLAGTAEVFTVTVPALFIFLFALLGSTVRCALDKKLIHGKGNRAAQNSSKNASAAKSHAVNGIFCRWTAARLHSTCYPAFVPALSGWKRKLGRFTGTES